MKAALSLLLVPGWLAAQGVPAPSRELPPSPKYSVTKAPGPIAVDGKLDDAGWQGAAPVGIDWEVAPGENTTPAAKTVCFVTFNAENFYLGCKASDPRPEQIRAHMVDRDNVEKLVLDDLVGVYIDPFNDQRRAFIFILNPYGVQADGVRTVAGGGEDYSWDAIWTSAGRRTDDGFEVELAIPFKSLRFPRTSEPQTWRISFVRSWPRTVRYRMQSAPFDRSSRCDLCRANEVSGFVGIAPGRNVEIVPTMTARRTDARESFPTGKLVNGDASPQIGGDLHVGITPNVSFNATVRPDFSQVEADVAQLGVNERFALFYPEKRPFFLEGNEFFQTPVQAVFTRTVADPDGGLKLTGKIGKNTNNVVGIFGARDRITNLLFPSNQGTGIGTLDQAAYTTVTRFRRDLGRNSHLGMLYTGRFGEGYQNQVVGADGFYQLGRSTSLAAQYIRSVTEYPDSIAAGYGQPTGAFGGGALNIALNHGTDRWHFGGSYRDFSPEFRADVGFVPRVDTRSVATYLSRVFYRNTGWFNVLSFGPYGSRTSSYDGTVTDQEAGMELSYEGPWQSFASLHYIRRDERYLGVKYSLDRTDGYFNVKPRAGLQLTSSWRLGDAIDYLNGRKATETMVSPSLQVSIGRGLTVDVNDTWQRLSTGGEKIFRANLLQTTVAYNFSSRTLVRTIVQYLDIDRNPTLNPATVPPEEKTLLGQFLFAYRVNPQTVLFLGYVQNSFGTDLYRLTRESRTFFAKIGYAWRP